MSFEGAREWMPRMCPPSDWHRSTMTTHLNVHATGPQFSSLERSPVNGITFLVGANGIGKSSFLASYAKNALGKGRNVVEIFNTIYQQSTELKRIAEFLTAVHI